ncbi:hypothetical protein KBTX_03398 [wastewater metagenome]|uniref:Uncharacterized protein n=2 Tax=unclassified sequences TaxID=12908 RepID=A0A5B8RG90_9ZZZZ|nr:hypothetical protein KBTEX_03398 [uncultured organism]
MVDAPPLAREIDRGGALRRGLIPAGTGIRGPLGVRFQRGIEFRRRLRRRRHLRRRVRGHALEHGVSEIEEGLFIRGRRSTVRTSVLFRRRIPALHRPVRLFGHGIDRHQSLEHRRRHVQDRLDLVSPLAHRFQIVLETGYGVGHVIQGGVVHRSRRPENAGGDPRGVPDELTEPGHRQKPADALQGMEAGGEGRLRLLTLAGLEVADDGLADPGHLTPGLFEGLIMDGLVLRLETARLAGLGVVGMPLGEMAQGGLDRQQGLGDRHNALVVRVAVHQRFRMLSEGTALALQPEHTEGIAHPVHAVGRLAQTLAVGVAGAHVQVKAVLDGGDVLPEHAGNGAQGIEIRTFAALGLQPGDAPSQSVQVVDLLHGADPPAGTVDAGEDIEHIPQQIGTRLGTRAEIGEALEFALQARQQAADLSVVAVHTARAQGLDEGTPDPPRGRPTRVGRRLVHAGQGTGHALQPVLGITAQPRYQSALEERTGPWCELHAPVPAVPRRAVLPGIHRTEIGCEQDGLGDLGPAMGTAQLVDDRQQRETGLGTADRETLEIAPKLEDRPHKRLTGRPGVGHVAGEQVARQRLHLLRAQRRVVELEHPEDAQHLVKMGGAELQPGLVAAVLRVLLQRFRGLLQRGVELTTHPAEHAVVHACLPAHQEASLLKASTSSPPTRCSPASDAGRNSPPPRIIRPPGRSQSARRRTSRSRCRRAK